jgi:hypothetical protein
LAAQAVKLARPLSDFEFRASYNKSGCGGAQLALFALYRFRTGSRQLNCLAVEFAEAVLDWRQTQLDN